jgi:hypothetical protein
MYSLRHLFNGGHGGLIVVVQIMDTVKKRRGSPRDNSGPEFKEAYARRASEPKTFGDLPEILHLKIFEMARVPDGFGEDQLTPIWLRAVCRRWKKLIDFSDDPKGHPDWSAYVDLDIRDIGGPEELTYTYRHRGWTVENLKIAFEEPQ